MTEPSSPSAPPLATPLQAAMGLHQAGRLPEAEQAYRHLLDKQAQHPDALHLLGLCLYQRGDAIGAAQLIEQSVSLAPGNPVAHNNLAAAWLACHQARKALASTEQALSLQAAYADAWINRGNALKALNRNEAALTSYARAQQLGHRSALLHYNRANLLHALGQFEAAVSEYQAALSLAPRDPMVWHNLGAAQDQMGQLAAACHSYQQALGLQPGLAYSRGHLLFAKLRRCDWQGLTELTEEILRDTDAGQCAAEPFALLALASTPVQQQRCARAYAAEKFPVLSTTPSATPPPQATRLRLGYFSADFHDHATAHLMAEVFEKHDRSRFERIAFSFGPRTHDVWQQRLERSFDQFLDVSERSDSEIAAQARALGIDIAIDLKGYTQHARTGIFALRAAPVQVNFLGYPGTLGAACMDYLIADRVVVPSTHRGWYDEKIVWLPDTYQPNDATKSIATHTPLRAELGLPEHGFVFCCFNNNYKITPDVFDLWMRLLRQVDGSVLWLLHGHADATSHLRSEAARRGIAADRLVFAPRLPLAEHLARHRQADLFLDTFHCNAHTTASDALWAGLPVLTCLGASFAGRVAASLLTAIGLPELITDSSAAYEALALSLARDSARLASLRASLAKHRTSHALFDSTRFTKQLETAFERMAERYAAGLPPAHIELSQTAPGVNQRPSNRTRL